MFNIFAHVVYNILPRRHFASKVRERQKDRIKSGTPPRGSKSPRKRPALHYTLYAEHISCICL